MERIASARGLYGAAAVSLAMVIRKLAGPRRWRLYSRKPDARTGKRRNLGTFGSRAAAVEHEREVQFFKRRR